MNDFYCRCEKVWVQETPTQSLAIAMEVSLDIQNGEYRYNG